jgi:hypothetical protein
VGAASGVGVSTTGVVAVAVGCGTVAVAVGSGLDVGAGVSVISCCIAGMIVRRASPQDESKAKPTKPTKIPANIRFLLIILAPHVK